MPDMNEAGAHTQVLLEEWRFRAEVCRQESARSLLKAELLDACARELERALREEAKKAGQL